jgi:hypothetical protein
VLPAIVVGIATLVTTGSGFAAAVDVVTPTVVQTIQTSTFAPSSPDPAGIVYDAATDRFIVSDSEVDEMPSYQGFNLYSATRTGSGHGTGTTLTHAIKEPTGLGYNPADAMLFVADDDMDRVSMVRPGPDSIHGTADDAVTQLSTAGFGSFDAEGVEYDASTGDLFVCDGSQTEIYRVAPVDGIFGNANDVVTSFDLGQFGARDCEGLGMDQRRGLLLAVDPSSRTIYEVTREGALARMVDLSGIPVGNGRSFASVSVAPSSDATDDPATMSYWVVDRQADSEADPSENDGLLYELAVPGEPHAGPTVNLTFPAAGSTVSGTVPVKAAATARDGVAQVAFFAGSAILGVDTNGADGWSAAWNTGTTPDGLRTLRATATDTAGRTLTAQITVRVSNNTVVLAADDFERTVTVGSNWGGCWIRAGSPHDVYSVSDGVGRITPTTSTAGMQVCTGVNAADVDVQARFTWSSSSVGTNLFPGGVIARYADAANFYAAQLRIEPATPGTLRVDLRRHLAGVSNALSTTTVATGFAAGTPVWLRFQVEGTALRVKVWRASDSEPTSWTSERTDANITAPGPVGYRYSSGGGAVSAPTVTIDDFTAESLGHAAPPPEPPPPTNPPTETSPGGGTAAPGIVPVPVAAPAPASGVVPADESHDDPISIRQLPRVGGVSVQSRIEQTFSRIASALAHRAVEVRCWSPADWRQLDQERTAYEDDGRADAYGFVRMSARHRLHLHPAICLRLMKLAYLDYRPRPGAGRRAVAHALLVLGHEAQHSAGVRSEAVAECRALQSVRGLGRELGVSRAYAAALATDAWRFVYPSGPRGVKTASCRNGGKLDIRPRSKVWP